MEFNQCPCSGKSLARMVQPAVMAILAEEPSHGYHIVHRLAELAIFRGQRPDPTGVYRLLKSMEDDGSVVATWDLAEAGPAKRRYELTPRGRACLARWITTLAEYQEAIEGLLQLAKARV
jgi:PadR family transcriptional regulator, regulatory protein PadR